MQEILILGNGLSRLSFEDKIRSFDGTIWACNRAYLDFGDIIHGLSGHTDVMVEAARYRDDNGLSYTIIGTDENPLTCKDLYRKDTGSTLVAEALTRGYSVNVCGFDLGGPDVYSPGHDKKNKTSWVQRWRLILAEFGADNVSFWGYDHKPFILSNRPAVEYFRSYSRGKPHVASDEYRKAFASWTGDYTAIWARIPCVLLENIGRREWKFYETSQKLDTGESIRLPKDVAEKYHALYPGEFNIKDLPTDDYCNTIEN